MLEGLLKKGKTEAKSEPVLKAKAEETKKEEYPNADLMLDIVRAEYDIENDRRKTLDSKISLFLSIDMGLLTAFVVAIPFHKVVKVIREWPKCSARTFQLYVYALAAIGVALVIASIILLILTAGVHTYNHVKLATVAEYSEYSDDRDISCLKQELVDHYYKIIVGDDNRYIGNRKVNEKRAKLIQVGVWLTIVSLLLLSFSFIALSFFIV